MLETISRWTLPPAIVLAALGLYRLVDGLSGSSDPPEILCSKPAQVTGTLREPRVCSDRQLAEIMARVKPPRTPFSSNNMVHALRLWGAHAKFGDDAIPSGHTMQGFLLDDHVYRQLAGDDSPPLLMRGPDGVECRSYDESSTFQHTSSYHTDDVLATLAESGTPLDARLKLRDGAGTVGELLASARRRFYLDRHEYEWSIIAFARYGWPIRPWTNKYGEKIDVSSLVTELTDKPAEIGPCGGLHRLEALVVMYQLDRQSPAMPPRARQRMLAYLKQASDRLVAAQSVEGYWTSGWSTAQSTVHSPKSKVASSYSLHDRLLVTGHHLEWLALAPDEVQPPRETIVRAGQWLSRTLLEMDEATLTSAYGPYSHAARALCLWKGIEPIDAWRQVGQRTLAAQ